MRVPGWLRELAPQRRHLRRDAMAGLPGAIASVPDGMAAAVLVGVNPIYGLYASMTGPIAGGLIAGTKLMVVTTTTAAALAAQSAIAQVPDDQRAGALFLLTILAGAVMLAAGVLRLGRFTRFVSHSVMIGFLTGVAVNIVLSQLGSLTGVATEGQISLAKAWSVLSHPGDVSIASLLVGLAAVAIIVGLNRTRLAAVSAVVAVVVPSLVVVLTGADVARVSDLGEVSGGLPLPAVPDLGALSPQLIGGALAVAAIVLVQGAGVAESAPNPGGRVADPSRDFIAQGAANLAAGLFRGQPVGGSVSQTAINRAFGARTRWASISSGLWMLVILVAFSGLVGQVAMPILAAVLIYASIGSLRPAEVTTIWRTSWISRTPLVVTFVATLILTIPAAVGVGVALSLLLQLNQEAMDLRLVRLVPRGDGQLVQQAVPRTLPSDAVTVLDVYGSLLYAGSRTLQGRLPNPYDAERAVVVLRLRGRTSLGATFYRVIGEYARQLAAGGGRLYLSGLSPALLGQLRGTGAVDLSGPVKSVEATDVLGESTRQAVHEAQAWLVAHRPEDPAAG